VERPEVTGGDFEQWNADVRKTARLYGAKRQDCAGLPRCVHETVKCDPKLSGV